MNRDKIAQMAAVTEAVYMNEFQKVQAILSREASLRSSLAQLRDQRHAAGSRQMQAIGADLAWQTWRDRSVQQLNLELARVMARKLESLDRVRAAFGRREAVRQLAQKSAEQKKRHRSGNGN